MENIIVRNSLAHIFWNTHVRIQLNLGYPVQKCIAVPLVALHKLEHEVPEHALGGDGVVAHKVVMTRMEELIRGAEVSLVNCSPGEGILTGFQGPLRRACVP